MKKFPIDKAREFATRHGCGRELPSIVDFSLSPPAKKAYGWSVLRGCIIEHLEHADLLEPFLSAEWPQGQTPKGQKHMAECRKRRDMYRLGELEGYAAKRIGSRSSVRPARSVAAPPSFAATDEASATRIVDVCRRLAECMSELTAENAIRSQRFLGDFGEWIVSQVFELPLCRNKTQKGWDVGYEAGPHIQVKTRVRSQRLWTTLRKGELNFDHLAIVVLTPEYRIEQILFIPKEEIAAVKETSRTRIVKWDQFSHRRYPSIPSRLAPLFV